MDGSFKNENNIWDQSQKYSIKHKLQFCTTALPWIIGVNSILSESRWAKMLGDISWQKGRTVAIASAYRTVDRENFSYVAIRKLIQTCFGRWLVNLMGLGRRCVSAAICKHLQNDNLPGIKWNVELVSYTKKFYIHMFINYRPLRFKPSERIRKVNKMLNLPHITVLCIFKSICMYLSKFCYFWTLTLFRDG
jgi:hypothetical protein